MFSYPIGQITEDEIHLLLSNVRKKYPFLSKRQSNYVAVEFLLEQRALVSKQYKAPTHLTCGDLIELIVSAIVLKFDLNTADDIKAISHDKLYQFYNDIIWLRIWPKLHFPDTDDTEIKSLVWQSFLKKLRKNSSSRLFCIYNGKLCLKQTLFQDYLMSQMTILALKKADRVHDRLRFLEYSKYFEQLMSNALRWRLADNLSEDDFKDIISEKIIYLLKEIHEPDFKLTSTLSTYFYSLVKNGVINFLKQKGARPHVPIDEITKKEEIEYFSEEERNFIESEEIYTQLVLKECRKATERTQDTIMMRVRGADYATIGRVLNETDNNVGTIVHRFGLKLRKMLRNLNQ